MLASESDNLTQAALLGVRLFSMTCCPVCRAVALPLLHTGVCEATAQLLMMTIVWLK
jgi:hypothetical protein